MMIAMDVYPTDYLELSRVYIIERCVMMNLLERMTRLSMNVAVRRKSDFASEFSLPNLDCAQPSSQSVSIQPKFLNHQR